MALTHCLRVLTVTVLIRCIKVATFVKPNNGVLAGSLSKLLGALTLSTSIRCFQIATFLKCVPFKLVSNQSLKVHLYKKWWRTLGWYGVNIAVYLYATFQIIGFTYNVGHNGITADSSHHIFYMGMGLMCVLYFTPMLLNRQGAVAFLNQLDFMLNLSENQKYKLGTKKWYRKPFAIFAINYFSVVILLFGAPILTVFFVLNPDGSMYLMSLFPLEWRHHTGVFILFVIIETIIVYWSLSILNAYFVFWCAIVFQNIIWLDALIRNQEQEARELPVDISEYGQITRDISTFQYVRVLTIFHNDFSRNFSSGFTASISIVAIWFIFGSFRCYEYMHIAFYLIYPFLGFFCVFLLSIFYPYITSWEMKSYDLFHLFRNRLVCSMIPMGDKKILLRRIKALRPVRNQLSHFGHTSFGVSRACIDEIFNEVLLLFELL